ncbi:MAG: hypothetical protein KBF66_10885 [Rhodoferax sp.]|uniref:hypothetical protein n=1 Tax=Rhodoferax sp. TaxID=50421 RepID=UPI001B799A65|nr:hypothetical protein [Rhodoferax sp.]MBP9906056.1 hypothetical protein [Rhodoferax sp.]
MRCFTLLSILFSTATTPAWGAAAADCPYDADYLSQQIGKKMQVVTQMKGLLGPACEYADDKREIKISVDAGPNPAPSADMWRKMANPPGTQWTRVAQDPDMAVLLASYPNGEPYPALSYERKGWLVQINVMGVKGGVAVGQWNNRLLGLKRLPP